MMEFCILSTRLETISMVCVVCGHNNMLGGHTTGVGGILTCWKTIWVGLGVISTYCKTIGAIIDGCEAILMDWTPYQLVGRSYGLDQRPY